MVDTRITEGSQRFGPEGGGGALRFSTRSRRIVCRPGGSSGRFRDGDFGLSGRRSETVGGVTGENESKGWNSRGGWTVSGCWE